jgi:hypothetical protein
LPVTLTPASVAYIYILIAGVSVWSMALGYDVRSPVWNTFTEQSAPECPKWLVWYSQFLIMLISLVSHSGSATGICSSLLYQHAAYQIGVMITTWMCLLCIFSRVLSVVGVSMLLCLARPGSVPGVQNVTYSLMASGEILPDWEKFSQIGRNFLG